MGIQANPAGMTAKEAAQRKVMLCNAVVHALSADVLLYNGQILRPIDRHPEGGIQNTLIEAPVTCKNIMSGLCS